MITLEQQQNEIKERMAEIKAELENPNLSVSDRQDLQDEYNGLSMTVTMSNTTQNGALISGSVPVSAEENKAIQGVYESMTPEEHAAAQESSINAEIARLETDLATGDDVINVDGLEKLGQKPSTGLGDFVFSLQGEHGTGVDDVFAHVHKDWVKKCISMENGLEILSKQQEMIEDFMIPLKAIKPVVTTYNNKPSLGFEFPNGKVYVPTAHAMVNLSIVDGPSTYSTWQIQDLMNPKEHATKTDECGEKVIRYQRDARDVETVIHILNGTAFRADRTDMNKVRLFRTWKDGTLRAVLSEQYAIVNNMWVMETIRGIIPNGILSHWKGDADSIYGNILIPDTIRQEKDSDYGGMLSVGNSEIGLRRISTTPSVFRSICMNGCIWDAQQGKGIKKKHRGEIKLDDLRSMIRANLQAQIPLLTNGVDKLLEARKFSCDNIPIRYVIAEVAQQLKLSKSQATGVFQRWAIERELLGKNEASTLFGIINALTRYGQDKNNSPEDWVKFDTLAGEMMSMTKDEWNRILSRANKLTDDDMEDIFSSKV